MRPLSIYFLSLIAIVVAFIARWLLDPVLGDHIPFATFFIAVAFAAWLGGLRPALLATGLGFVLAWYCFIPTRFSFELKELQHTIGLAVYLTVGFALAGFGEATRIAQARLADQKEQLRTTFASIGDGVISTDASGNVTYLNAVAESLTGWLSREAEGVPLTQVFRIVNESTRQEVENPAMRALQQGIIIGLANHTILIAKDGTEHHQPLMCGADRKTHLPKQ